MSGIQLLSAPMQATVRAEAHRDLVEIELALFDPFSGAAQVTATVLMNDRRMPFAERKAIATNLARRLNRDRIALRGTDYAA